MLGIRLRKKKVPQIRRFICWYPKLKLYNPQVLAQSKMELHAFRSANSAVSTLCVKLAVALAPEVEPRFQLLNYTSYGLFGEINNSSPKVPTKKFLWLVWGDKILILVKLSCGDINIHFLCYSEPFEIKKNMFLSPFFFLGHPKPPAFRKNFWKVNPPPYIPKKGPKSGTPKPWKLAVNCKPCRRCPSKYTTKAVEKRWADQKFWKKTRKHGRKPWKIWENPGSSQEMLRDAETNLFKWPLRTYPQRKKQTAIL